MPGEEPVWKRDLAHEKRGMKVLGSPLGSNEYVRALGEARLEEEQKLLEKRENAGRKTFPGWNFTPTRWDW